MFQTHFSGRFERLDLSTLKQLHRLHVMSVPFENLSLHCGQELPMDPARVWNKIVSAFNNSLMGKVEVEGRCFMVDVSFRVSKQIWEPLELVSGKEQPQTPGVFRLMLTGEVWALEKTSRRPHVLTPRLETCGLVNAHLTRPLYCFILEPWSLEDFSGANAKLQTDPSSLFLNKSIVSLQREVGLKALVGWLYSHVTNKPDLGQDLIEMREVQEGEELEEVLRAEYNIRLNSRLWLTDRKMLYTL